MFIVKFLKYWIEQLRLQIFKIYTSKNSVADPYHLSGFGTSIVQTIPADYRGLFEFLKSQIWLQTVWKYNSCTNTSNVHSRHYRTYWSLSCWQFRKKTEKMYLLDKKRVLWKLGSIFWSEYYIFVPSPRSEDDSFSPSRNTSFFDSHCAFLALDLPYFASIFYVPFSLFLFPFLFSLAFSPLLLFPFHYFPQMMLADIPPGYFLIYRTLVKSVPT